MKRSRNGDHVVLHALRVVGGREPATRGVGRADAAADLGGAVAHDDRARVGTNEPRGEVRRPRARVDRAARTVGEVDLRPRRQGQPRRVGRGRRRRELARCRVARRVRQALHDQPRRDDRGSAGRALDPVVEPDRARRTRRGKRDDRSERARRVAGARRHGRITHERVRDGGVRRGRVAHERVGHRGIGDRAVRHGRIRDSGIRERRIDRSRVGGRGVSTRVCARVRERADRDLRAVCSAGEQPSATRRVCALAAQRYTTGRAEPAAQHVDASVVLRATDGRRRARRACEPRVDRHTRIGDCGVRDARIGDGRVGRSGVRRSRIGRTGIGDGRVGHGRIRDCGVRDARIGDGRVGRVGRSGVRRSRIGRTGIGDGRVGRSGVRSTSVRIARHRVARTGVRRGHADQSPCAVAEPRDRRTSVGIHTNVARSPARPVLDALVLVLPRRRVAHEDGAVGIRETRVTHPQGSRREVAIRSLATAVDGLAGRPRLLRRRSAAHVERRHHGNAAQETGEPDARQAIPLHVPLLPTTTHMRRITWVIEII